MSLLEVEKLAKQIKLNRDKGLYFVEGLSNKFAQAVAEEVGVVCIARERDGKLEISTITKQDIDDSSMERIISLFGELESEGERKVLNNEDIYLLDLLRGYELVLDKDSYLQQQLPILADSNLLEWLKLGGAE